MFLLSLVSFFNFYSFVLIGLFILKINRRDPLNRTAAMVNFCFAIWNFSYTFFYMAPAIENAAFWHKASSLGWILFCPFATHFFLILSKRPIKWNSYKIYLLIYALPVILVIKTFAGDQGSVVAKTFVQSTSGLGWTYVTDAESPWCWIYILSIIGYFSISLSYTYQWAKRSDRLRFLKQARSIILLDIVMISAGFIIDIVLPVVSHTLPPLFNIVSIVWGVGFAVIVKNYKLANIDEAATPELILKTVMEPLLLLDKEGIISKCNLPTLELLKYGSDQVIGKPLYHFYRNKLYNEVNLKQLFVDKVLKNKELELSDALGNSIYAVASFSLAESKLDGIVGVVVSLHNITKYKHLTDTLEILANQDKLTKLPNRRMFHHELDAAIERYKETGKSFAVVYADLDGFKNVNDCFGHDTGDKLLVDISKKMSSVLRTGDIFARIGGDEFILLVTNYTTDTDLEMYLEEISDVLKNPIIVEHKICRIGISFGISVCPEDGTTAKTLINNADERMYDQKSDKRRMSNQ